MNDSAMRGIPTGTTVDAATLYGLRQRAQWAVPALQWEWVQGSSAAGPRLSRARSRGMEYESSRVYMPGDDVRHIDWRVTARTGDPHTKLFHESRGRGVMMVVDLGESMHFGTRSAFKSVVAAHAAVLLAWASVDAGDRVGGVVSAPEEAVTLRLRTGTPAVLGLADVLARHLGCRAANRGYGEHPARGPVTVLTHGLENLVQSRVESQGSADLFIVISDLYGLDAGSQPQLEELARRAPVLLCWVVDPLEIEPPPAGRYPITDGDARKVLDSHEPRVCAALREQFDARVRQIHELTRGPRIRCIAIRTGADVAVGLGACVPADDVRSRFRESPFYVAEERRAR